MTFNFYSRGVAACVLVGLAVLAFARSAMASPRPLPFTYPYETLAKGEAELELYSDLNPLRVLRDPLDAAQGRLWGPQYILQSEFEYGLSDRTELGFYQVFKADPEDGGGNKMSFDGFKWRVRTRLFEADELPIDVALYLELETLHDELALEEKILLQKRLGRVRLMANLWVEQELDRPFDRAATGESKALKLVINPTFGGTYQITPVFHLGGEYWARGVYGPKGSDLDQRNEALHHFLGPVVHLNFGKLWWTSGLYANLNDSTKPQPGESYGPWWFRTVLGVDL
jgi:hypothetical protein